MMQGRWPQRTAPHLPNAVNVLFYLKHTGLNLGPTIYFSFSCQKLESLNMVSDLIFIKKNKNMTLRCHLVFNNTFCPP